MRVSIMKLSCLPVSLYEDIFSGKRSILDWVHFGADLGLDGIDVSVKFFPTRETQMLEAIFEEAQRAELDICTLVCYPDFTHPDAFQREREIEQMKSDVRLAATLGAKFVRVTAGQNHPGLHRKQGICWAVEGLCRVLDEAEKVGVILAYENHTKGAPWQYWDFSQPGDIFLEILGNFTDTSLKVCFDTANPLVLGEDPIALLKVVKERVVTVHVFDIRAPNSFEPVLVGTGVSPIKEVLSVLKHGGFDGWLSVEEASHTGCEGFKKATSFVRHTWGAV
ncbi:TPA: hypothetical protein EYO63_00390 [Candidatus Poribacteria bacterium]|nr:hypothetical protein [Candidatus Poribacteria bacterium]